MYTVKCGETAKEYKMSKFKVGDKVKYINADIWSLVTGEVYTITHVVCPYFGLGWVGVDGPRHSSLSKHNLAPYLDHEFELVTDHT